MLFSVLLVLGVCLVPAHSKQAGRHNLHTADLLTILFYLPEFVSVVSLVKI